MDFVFTHKIFTQFLDFYRFFGFRTEGFRGFYKGLKPNLVRVVPATAITFVVYENVWHFVRSKRENHDDD